MTNPIKNELENVAVAYVEAAVKRDEIAARILDLMNRRSDLDEEIRKKKDALQKALTEPGAQPVVFRHNTLPDLVVHWGLEEQHHEDKGCVYTPVVCVSIATDSSERPAAAPPQTNPF